MLSLSVMVVVSLFMYLASLQMLPWLLLLSFWSIPSSM